MAIRERHAALVRLFWRRLSIVVLILLIVVAGFAVWGVSEKERESRALREQAERQLNDLREQEASLSGHIRKLKTDRGKEEALREQYGVGREGEGLIVIVESPQVEQAKESPTLRQWVRRFLPFW